MAKNIQLIIGSARQNRMADDVAAWIIEQAKQSEAINLEVIDLKEQNLPFFDSPVPPLYAPNESPAGKAWAEVIGRADGFIFLTPEYNRSIPAVLKNALDFLVAEWKEKPAGIVSYGWTDGGKNAALHLKDVLGMLKVEVVEPQIALHFQPEIMDENGKLRDSHEAFAPHNEDLSTIFSSLS
jgi:NAD(P)H-dependent FMN reductase